MPTPDLKPLAATVVPVTVAAVTTGATEPVPATTVGAEAADSPVEEPELAEGCDVLVDPAALADEAPPVEPPELEAGGDDGMVCGVDEGTWLEDAAVPPDLLEDPGADCV